MKNGWYVTEYASDTTFHKNATIIESPDGDLVAVWLARRHSRRNVDPLFEVPYEGGPHHIRDHLDHIWYGFEKSTETSTPTRSRLSTTTATESRGERSGFRNSVPLICALTNYRRDTE